MSNINELQVANNLGEATQTPGHNIVQAPNFPSDSIGWPNPWFMRVWRSLLGLFRPQRQTTEDKPWLCKSNNFTTGPGSDPYIRINADTWLQQDIELPITYDPGAPTPPGYSLGCKYDVLYFDTCWLTVWALREGKPAERLFYEPLRGLGTPRGGEGEQVREWQTLTPLALDMSTVTDKLERVRVQFDTPVETGRPFLYLTAVQLHAHLGEPGVEKLTLHTDPPDAGVPDQTKAPYLLCHGAKPVLSVQVAKGDAWEVQRCSLQWLDENGLPPGNYGLTARPLLNVDDADQPESYQLLSAGVDTDWQLALTDESWLQSGATTLGLGSYWIAPKHAFAVKVGHFRYDISKLDASNAGLIIDQGDEAQVIASVKSPFSAAGLAGIEVRWKINGKEHTTIVTDDKGQSLFKYTPTREDIDDNGQMVVEAECTDGFDRPSTESHVFNVFETSPWPAQMEFLLGSDPIEAFKWGELQLICGQQYTLTLGPKAGEKDFVDKKVWLDWPDGETLGIDLGANEPREMTKTGLTWTITAGSAVRGIFSLQALVEGLKVGYGLKGVQMRPLAEELEAFEAPICRRGTAYTLALRALADSPLAKMPLEACLVFEKDGALVAGDIKPEPEFDEWAEFEAGTADWALIGQAKSGWFKLQIEVKGLGSVTLPRCAMISPRLEDEFTITLGEWSATKPFILWYGDTASPQTLRIEAMPDSPVTGLGFDYRLQFDEQANTTRKEHVKPEPEYGMPQQLSSNAAFWKLTGQRGTGEQLPSGTFGLTLLSDAFAQAWVMGAGILMSEDLADEAGLTSAGDNIDGTDIYWRKETKELLLKARTGSPLAKAGLEATLGFSRTGELVEADVGADPGYGKGTPLKENGVPWKVSAKEKSGTFGLSVTIPGFKKPLLWEKCAVLARNLGDEGRLVVTGSEVLTGGCFWLESPGEIKYIPHKGSALYSLGLKMKLHFVSVANGGVGQGDITPSPDYGRDNDIHVDGATWKMQPKTQTSGIFNLEVELDKFTTRLPLGVAVLMSTDLGKEIAWVPDYDPLISHLPRDMLVKHKKNSPLAALKLSLELTIKDDQYPSSWKAVPGLGKGNPVDAAKDSTRWSVTGTVSGAKGELSFSCSLFKAPVKAGTVHVL
ncbi:MULTISPECIES: hypothetical protein [unclassified Pseudomonas]|uniref:hypothetical protein n=1 Tax=unclassified Pseudomonas TaxID=196821 RepID=UPI002096C493|nr:MULTISPECIES: hypothetical protein [unclassified Pseudomonas]MCO7520852.1 hypothetical protein [Pseudomonas sp. 1]MCO7542763.1 hypothetical protein [Pseudomonas sp. VA159-2]